MSITIADIQAKIIKKMEQKHKGSINNSLLTKIFGNKEAFLTQSQFNMKLEQGANALSPDEERFLFSFYDTMAGQQDPTGSISVDLVIQDLLHSVGNYSTGFRSGEEDIKSNKNAKGNLPSQQGGIFGGGSYAADARDELPRGGAPPQYQQQQAMAAPSNRPRGNQSSIAGGIFGEAGPPEAPALSNRGGNGGNKSNRSSVQGGIFGEEPTPQVAQKQGRNSNQSSIPGGIFG